MSDIFAQSSLALVEGEATAAMEIVVDTEPDPAP
jgi:hypothetical protein